MKEEPDMAWSSELGALTQLAWSMVRLLEEEADVERKLDLGALVPLFDEEREMGWSSESSSLLGSLERSGMKRYLASVALAAGFETTPPVV